MLWKSLGRKFKWNNTFLLLILSYKLFIGHVFWVLVFLTVVNQVEVIILTVPATCIRIDSYKEKILEPSRQSAI